MAPQLIEWKPIFQLIRRGSPQNIDRPTSIENDMLDFVEENGLGSSQREVVLKNLNVQVRDEDSFVVIDSLELVHLEKFL